MTLKLFFLRILETLGLIEVTPFRIENCRDVPVREHLSPDIVAVVGDPHAPKWANFLCPCGCGAPLLLSLNPQRRPRWTVTQTWSARPTIKPSIRRPDGCRSHFWIRAGKVDWCKDTGK